MISFLLGLNLNVTQRNIKLHDIVQCKQNAAKVLQLMLLQ